MSEIAKKSRWSPFDHPYDDDDDDVVLADFGHGGQSQRIPTNYARDIIVH